MTGSEDGSAARRGLSRRQLLGYTVAASAGALALQGGRALAATSSGPTVVDPNLFDLAGSHPEGVAPARAMSRAASPAWGGYANGQIPLSALSRVPVSVGQPYLEPAAAAAYRDLSAAFAGAFGSALAITEGYRDLARQKALYAAYQAGTGALAATPGTSIHGWGKACDFGSGVASYGTSQKTWMNANAPKFGWQPVGDGFSQAEPWHFEYDGSYKGSNSGGTDGATDEDMRIIQSAGRGIAAIGPGYFFQLPEGEFVSQAVALWGNPYIGNDRQFDVWRSIVLQGTTA